MRRVVRGGFLAMLIATAIALSGSGALAAHQVNSSGAHGSYSWTDSAAHPAGHCNYAGGGTAGHTYITYIKVKAPTTVFWPTGTGTSSGTVGFKVILQHLSGGTWTNVNTGSGAFATATTTTSASFPARRVAWAGPNTGKDRAKVVLTWHTIGRVQVVIDHYSNGFDGVGRSYCPVVFTNG